MYLFQTGKRFWTILTMFFFMFAFSTFFAQASHSRFQNLESKFHVYTPGEWEKHSHLMMKWVDEERYEYYNHSQMEIIKSIQQHTNDLLILITNNKPRLLKILAKFHIPQTQLLIVVPNKPGIIYPWIRDYAPQSTYFNLDPYLVKWLWWPGDYQKRPEENRVGEPLAGELELFLVDLWEIDDPFKVSGGNFMTDGMGKSFHHPQILHENLEYEKKLKDYHGIDNPVLIPEIPGLSTMHVDYWMRFIDEETLIAYTNLDDNELARDIEKNVKLVTSNNNIYERDYRVIWINNPVAPDEAKYLPTYVNSAIFNNVVFVPQYNNYGLDRTAIRIYQDALPGYQIEPIDCSEILTKGNGATRCLTHQVAAPHPIRIYHPRLFDSFIPPDRGESGEFLFFKTHSRMGYPVEALVYSKERLNKVELSYVIDDQSETIPMIRDGNSRYFAQIPPATSHARIKYKISAYTDKNNICKPAFGYYEFIVQTPQCRDDQFKGGAEVEFIAESGTEGLTFLNSAKSILVPPNITFRDHAVFWEAPVITYLKEPGQYDDLYLGNSQMSIRANKVDLPFLQIGDTAPEDGFADISALEIFACEPLHIEEMELNSIGPVYVEAKKQIYLGPLSEPETAVPSIKYNAFCKATFVTNDLIVAAPFYMEANVPNLVDNIGHLRFLTPQGSVLLNPDFNTIFDFSIWLDLAFSAKSFVSNNVYFQLYEDATLNMFVQENMRLDNTRISIPDVKPSDDPILEIIAQDYSSQNSGELGRVWLEFFEELDAVQLEKEIHRIEVPVPGPRKKNTTDKSETDFEDIVTIRAASLEMRGAELLAGPNSTIVLEAGDAKLHSFKSFGTKKEGGAIHLKAMNRKRLETYNKEFQEKSAKLHNSLQEKQSTTTGSLKKRVASTITELQTESSSAKSLRKSTEQVSIWPNPFNPDTRIMISLDRTCLVRVDIFDLLGRHVTTLYDDRVESGALNLNWMARNYSSGTYFCLVQGVYEDQTQFRQTHKLLLLK